jgi:hypothetical protein
MAHQRRPEWFSRLAAAIAACALGSSCAGGGQSGGIVPVGGSAIGTGGVGNTVVRIFVPAGTLPNAPGPRTLMTPTPPPLVPLTGAPPVTTPAPPLSGSTPTSPGSQALAINVSGPTTINQSISVGPNASGCAPVPGGTSCQLSLSLPAGTYTGTIGSSSSAIAFTVTPATNNVLNLTLGGTPSAVAIVPASFLSVTNPQGGVDLLGAGRHPVLVELVDANQNVIVGNSPVSFTLSQAGGALSLAVSQGSATSPNLYYVNVPAVASSAAGFLRATASYQSIPNPCLQGGATCNGTVRVNVRQLLAVANSGGNNVALYANGQNVPLATIQNGITAPQAVVFDAAGDLFVANQSGSVSEFAPPYGQPPTIIANGVNHPQALAVDSRGNLFVANGSGSNTVTVYSSPFGGRPSTVITAAIDDPVSLALDSSGDLFVVNAASNTVTEYAPPYAGTPVAISKGLNAPNSLALDGHGNLFVANLNSTPNSVVEFTPPFTDQSSPVATITNGVNEQGAIGLNGAANLFVPNQGANTVTEYVPPYANPPTTIVGGQSQPVALAIDVSGNLYVANYGNNTVTVYASPYGGGAWTTLSSAISAPIALALSPATNTGAALLP